LPALTFGLTSVALADGAGDNARLYRFDAPL
jgi:hypothetical protein